MPQHIYQWHPIFVHFTIALLAASVAFYVIAAMIKPSPARARLIAGAELNLWVGTAVTVITAIFGWLAFDSVPHDDSAHELMIRHRSLALATFAAFVALAAVSMWHRRHAGYPSALFAIGLLAGLGLLGATGLVGGHLVYQHGLGVEARTHSGKAEPASKAVVPERERKDGEAAPKTAPAPDHHHDHPHR